MRRLLSVVLGLGALLGWTAPASRPADSAPDNFFTLRARAQSQAQAVLYAADASAFPTISAFMDVFDVSGRFVSGIQPAQVTVFEDGQAVPLGSLTETLVPMQLAVAINPGAALAVRDSTGKVRFDAIVGALGSWIQALPADTQDDMSLVTLSGPVISHASPRDWLVSLQSLRPDFRDSVPNLQTLQIAIQTVAVQAPRVGMKRAVFFITPHMDDANIESMVTPLTQLAIQNNVHVFVWFTDSQLYAATASATAFTNLAQQTGGAYFAVTELQPYPDPESYFAPLRRLYALQYVSAARTGGSHTLGVEVVGQAGAVRSVDQSFTINLEPPNPIFVTPPLQILRSPPADDPYNEKVLLPENQPLELIIEFPDSHPRALVRTTLYVDGQVAAENTAEPFDKFTWDLTAYRETGEHKITVEVVDALGLSKSSIEVPVMVTVIQPPHGISALFSRYRQSIIIGAVAFAGLALLLIIFMGRLRSLSSGMRSRRAVQGDPLTQTIHTEPKPAVFVAEKTIKRPRTTAPRAAATKAAEAPAFLRPLQPDPLAEPGKTFKPAAGAAIPLSAREITFGTDPKQSSYVLADASLDPRHARITRNENGDFFVVDAGTIGGTWVNFEPVGPEAHLLRHGDVLHFGQLVFRFELKEPPPPAEPKVTKLPP